MNQIIDFCFMKWFLAFILACSFVFETSAQELKISSAIFEGNIVVGYVNKGAFLNFTGPGVSWKSKDIRFLFSMLPTLRFKKDFSSNTRNSFVTPSLGCGISFHYKKVLCQIPIYYNAKSTSENGSWHLGFGLGVNLTNPKK